MSTFWRPGAGVLLFGGGLNDAAVPTQLDEELWMLTAQARVLRRRKQRFFLAFLILASVVILAAVAIPIMVAAADATFLWLATAYVAAIALSAGWTSLSALRDQHDLKKEMGYLADKIDLAEFTKKEEKEKRAYNLFKLNGRELQRYYDQALWQRSSVFVLGVVCILGGFASIAWAFVVIGGLGATGDLNDKIVVAVLGGTGAILADFVAVIFLRMFSRIVKSTVEFHLRLVGTHHAHFGSVLASRIEDNPTMTNETLQKLAVALVTPASKPAASAERATSVTD